MESLARDIEKDLHLVGEAAYKIWGTETQDYSALNERFEAIKRKQDEITRLEADLAAIDERDSQILGTAERQEEIAPAIPKLPIKKKFSTHFNTTPAIETIIGTHTLPKVCSIAVVVCT